MPEPTNVTPPYVTLQREMLPDLTTPHPIRISEDGSVADQEFWKGEPAALMGFQRDANVQNLDLLWEHARTDLGQIVGLYPVFVRDGGNVYVDKLAIECVKTGSITYSARPEN